MRRRLINGSSALLVGLLAALFVATASAQSGETIRVVSIDADPAGNTATFLGPPNACVSVEPGASVTLDLVVDSVPASRGVIGFQVNVEFDPGLLILTAVDNEFLLGANGSYEPFEGLSAPLPDASGNYAIIIADLASTPPFVNIESGAGVLSRLKFTAQGTGLSTVAPIFNPPDEYPTLLDNTNTMIGVDGVGAATVAVGQGCPSAPDATPIVTDLPPIDDLLLETPTATAAPTSPGETPSPTPTLMPPGQTPSPTRATGSPAANGPGAAEEDGGTASGIIIAIAALAGAGVLLATAGGFILYRRRSGGP